MASTTAEGGLAGRYALALFELAQDAKALDAVSGDLMALSRALQTSPDLARLVNELENQKLSMIAKREILNLRSSATIETR